MKLRTRFAIAFSSLLIIVACLLLNWMLEDVKPRYREAVEECMNDTAHVIAGFLEEGLHEDSNLPLERLERVFVSLEEKRIEAEIYQIVKKKIDLGVYVSDKEGIILYSSVPEHREGSDYSQWNDVYLTLRGKYGARTSRRVKSDPSSSSMYVAAPIRGKDGSLLGVVSVVKPVDAVLQFMKVAKRRIFSTAAIALVSIIIFGGILTLWVTRPLQILTQKAKAISEGERLALDIEGAGEISSLSKTMEEMRQSLEGRHYVENYVETLSHEMKAPLAAIKGGAELLGENPPKQDRDRFLDNILKESDRLREVVDRMLLLASLESRDSLKALEEIEPQSLLEEVQESLETIARAKDLQMIVRKPKGKAAAIYAETFLLHHALKNLGQNALDFSLPKSSVFLYYELLQSNEIEFIVEDQGVGIPEYAKDKVFKRFYSLERPRGRKKSSGLGLSFVQEVAKLHRGSCRLEERKEGTGVIARLRLPMEQIRAS